MCEVQIHLKQECLVEADCVVFPFACVAPLSEKPPFKGETNVCLVR